MKIRTIINPISGTVSKSGLDRLVAERLRAAGHDVQTCFTTGRGDATRLASEAAELGFDAVVVAGGDGTVNEAASALIGSSTSLAILPCGSGNGLARHAEIPLEPLEALECIHPENIEAVDCGFINGKTPFFCTIGLGFDAAVSHAFAAKARRGKMTYIRSALETFLHYNPTDYQLELEDGRRLDCRAFLVAVCNASQYGNNAFIAPRATITDGLLDVTLMHAGNHLSSILVGMDMLTGYIDRNTLVETFRVRRILIECPSDTPMHIDGEPVEAAGGRIDIECRPGALRLFMPSVRHPFKPIITPMRGHLTDILRDIRHLLHG